MDLITADFETYYDDAYSLSKLTTEAYIRDPRFEPILVSLKFNDSPAFWILPDRFRRMVEDQEVDWANTAVIHHHSHFDGAVLAWHYGVKPAMFIDTLPMARVIDGPKAGNSLHDLCIRHGVGGKGDYVTYAKGKHLADFTTEQLNEYGRYCCNDSDRTYDLAQLFLPQIPMDELRLIDLTTRMFTEPMFQGDVAKLAGAVATERARKIELLRAVGLNCPRCHGTGWDAQLSPALPPIVCKACDGTTVDKKTIGSNEKFANLLRAQQVEPVTKTSPTTGKQIYAFAKTDPAMQALEDSADETVAALAAARLGIKSNIIETRAERFRDCASRGPMPVYISYGAAHTLRWGGGDKMNWQNLSGENMNRPEMSVIAASVQAPPGHKVLAADSSQGEARIIGWLANQHDLIEAFAQGRDVYSEFASTVYQRMVNRKLKLPDGTVPDHIPGQVGKICILSFGFGSGWYTAAIGFLKGVLGAPPIQFKHADMLALNVDPQPFLNKPGNVTRVSEMPSRLELNDRFIHCAVTEALVARYRFKYAKIKEFWGICDLAIEAMAQGREMVFGAHGVMRTGKEYILMPNGLKLHYRGLERGEGGEWSYFDGRARTKIYGSLVAENVTQCLHRIAVAGQMLEIAEVLPVKLMRHDDVVTVVPEGAADAALQYMLACLKKTPAWAVGLPLTAEGGIGDTLLGAK